MSEQQENLSRDSAFCEHGNRPPCSSCLERESDNQVASWKQEEAAPFEGWSFSHLEGRWEEEKIELGYERRVRELLSKASSGLDIGTGGGEFLASLPSLPERMCAIEYWPPNVAVAKEKLEPLGVEVEGANVGESLTFRDGVFDVIIDRQAAFVPSEIARVLQVDGRFLTQQVSGDNLADLVREFGGDLKFPFWTREKVCRQLEDVGLHIEHSEVWSGKMTFKDVGALVYFLKNVPWVVPDFSVERYKQVLLRLQQRIERGEELTFTQKRFLIEATKPAS